MALALSADLYMLGGKLGGAYLPPRRRPRGSPTLSPTCVDSATARAPGGTRGTWVGSEPARSISKSPKALDALPPLGGRCAERSPAPQGWGLLTRSRRVEGREWTRHPPQELGVGVVARISVAGRGASYPGMVSKNARPRRAPAAATPRKGRRPGFSSPSILVPPAVWPEEEAVTLLYRNCKVPL